MVEERWEEGTGQLRRNIYDRLLALGMATSESDPSSFRDKLYLHFDRLPPRYLIELGVGKAEDVLLHRRMLDECADPDRRPVFHARFLKYETALEPGKEGGSDPEFSADPCQKLLQDLSLEKRKAADNTASSMSISSRDSEIILLHEIIFSSIDRPKLLMRLTALLSEVGLNIREAHVYSTTDGYCLDVFVVDGWETEETDDLLTKIKETLTRKNASTSNSTNSSASERLLELQQQVGDSEIAWNMLTSQLRRNIYDRLLSLGMATSESDPSSFRDKLYLHFDRFPPRYLIKLGVHKAEDVLLHWRLLADCADPGKRPVVHARFLECIQVAVDYDGGPEALPLPGSRGRKEEVLVHEIIFASIDKPKLLSQRSALLYDVGLNIREAHVYSTPDGFSLIIFLADGWCEEEADGLLKEIKETLARRQLQASPSSTRANSSASE